MDNLKPCPFCGKYPQTVVDDETEEKIGVKCFACGGSIYPEKDTLQEAIEAWNRRAESKGVPDINVGDNGIMWQYCRDPNDINKAMDKHDENWAGLTSVEQIISITYDTNHGCYVVFWCKQ